MKAKSDFIPLPIEIQLKLEKELAEFGEQMNKGIRIK
jgi:hypothetical protein